MTLFSFLLQGVVTISFISKKCNLEEQLELAETRKHWDMKAAITDNGHFNHAAVPVINVHSDHDSRYPPLTNDVNMVNENGKSNVSDSGFLMNSLSDFIFCNTLFKTFIAK